MAASKRARTADREAAVELINTAYVDGQLSGTERDDKVSRALEARTMAQVERATSGLQTPLPTTPTAAVSTGRFGRWWRGRSRAARTGIAAVLVVALSGAVVAMLDQADDQRQVVQTQRRPVAVDAEMVSDLLVDYQSKFDTTRSYGIIVMRDWTRVLVPTEDGRARYEEWTLVTDGTFEQTGTRGADDLKEFDLADVDVDALTATIKAARSDLGVEDPRRTDVVIDHRAPQMAPEVSVSVANKYEESAYVVTDLAGKVMTREPYVTS